MKMRTFAAIPVVCSAALIFFAQSSIAQTNGPKNSPMKGGIVIPSESIYLEENSESGSNIGLRLLMVLEGGRPEEVQSETTSKKYIMRSSKPAQYKLEIFSRVGTGGKRFDKLRDLSLVVDGDCRDFGRGHYSVDNNSDLAQESVKWSVTKEQLLKLEDAKTLTVKLYTGSYTLNDNERLVFQEWISRMTTSKDKEPD